jgi:hypothetical protein
MRLDTCRASPQVVAAGGMASSGAREPVEDPASKVLITSSVADHFCIRNRRFQWSAGVSGTQLDHNFLRSNEIEGV